MPPLPHHRAYGSVPRRFGGSCFDEVGHGGQAPGAEASFAQCLVQGFGGAQAPRPFGALGHHESGRSGYSEATEFPDTSSRRLPPHPGEAAHAAEANVATVGNDTIVIAGHNMPGQASPLSNKAELAEYCDMLVAIRENVAKLKLQGRPLDETVAAKPTAAFDAKWGQFLITPALFTKLVYKGV